MPLTKVSLHQDPRHIESHADGMTDCLIWEDIVSAAIYVNPCFNFYHLTGMFLIHSYLTQIRR